MKSHLLFFLFVLTVLDVSVLGLRSHIRKRAQDDGMSIEDEPRYNNREEGTGVLDQILAVFSDTFNKLVQDPENRARFHQQPQKPPTLEINTNTVLHAIEKLLSSEKVKKITRNLARQAAIVYRAIEDEF